jgi:hypothetical protein
MGILTDVWLATLPIPGLSFELQEWTQCSKFPVKQNPTAAMLKFDTNPHILTAKCLYKPVRWPPKDWEILL